VEIQIMFLNVKVHDNQNRLRGEVKLQLDLKAKKWSIPGQPQGWIGVGYSNPPQGVVEVKSWGVVWLWDQRPGEHHSAILWDAPTTEFHNHHTHLSGQGRIFDPKDASFKDGKIEWEVLLVDFPPRPSFVPLTSTQVQSIFGKFDFSPDPHPNNKEQIKIHGAWVQKNIVNVSIPQLARSPVKGAPASVLFHRLGAKQLMALWVAWEQAGLLDRVHTLDGFWVARFKRNSKTDLSDHAFGTAFDINGLDNKWGHTPAKLFTEGCVRELVPIANQFGFFWGGHFSTTVDGMHFEIAQLK
jgi:hypothetical protein